MIWKHFLRYFVHLIDDLTSLENFLGPDFYYADKNKLKNLTIFCTNLNM